MTELKCKHCGTTTTKRGEPFKNGSALWTHENAHCDKRPNKKTKAAASDKKKCDCNDGGKWRLLNPRVQEEYAAMQHGAEEVCTVCKELV